MHDGIRFLLCKPGLEYVVVAGDVDQMKMDAPAGFLMPDAGAFLDGIHWCQRLHPEFGVDPAATQIVNDVNVMALIRQVKCRRPADKAVTAENCNFHGPSLRSAAAALAHECDRFAWVAQTTGFPAYALALTTELWSVNSGHTNSCEWSMR